MRVLVTGGAGYIGSHTLLQLLRAQHEVLVLDNFSNSSPDVIDRVRRVSNASIDALEVDVRDSELLHSVFADFLPEAVIHFAGLKAVGESCKKPIDYYSHNVAGAIEVLRAMNRHGCRRMVFSSTATIYGESDVQPVHELCAAAPMSPYGRSKLFVEEIIRDWSSASPGSSAVLLRYFNPVGADASGLLGEDPSGLPNNLLPYVSQVAHGKLQRLSVFGNDYDTRDGTGERDYVHVEDLARAHVSALEFTLSASGCEAINLGTGSGTTVLEMIDAFERASGRTVPYVIVPRREGDVARSLADVRKAEHLLGWKSRLGIAQMCETAWRWQTNKQCG